MNEEMMILEVLLDVVNLDDDVVLVWSAFCCPPSDD